MAMGEVKDNEAYGEELLFYEEEDQKAPDFVKGKPSGDSAKKGYICWNPQLGVQRFPVETRAELLRAIRNPAVIYVGIHSSGFRDFLLKPELLRAIRNPAVL